MIRGIRFTTALLSTSVLAFGCSGGEAKSPIHQIATPNVAHVEGGKAQDINDWLAENQGRRIVAFTGILDYREQNSGYKLVVKAGDNLNQHCEGIGRTDVAVQTWINDHPGRLLLGIASVPAYSGGVDSYVVCSDAGTK